MRCKACIFAPLFLVRNIMELRQLRYFIGVAESLNFSEAARNLYVTQSTLSQQIKALEDELGTTLFQRDSHSVELTETGARLLPLAQRTVQDAESCKSQIQDMQDLLTGELKIGVTYSFSPILTEAVKMFIHKYPGIRLSIVYRTMGDLMDMLRRRKVDFVLAFKPNSPYDEIESHHLFEDILCVILRKDNPLSGLTSISMEQLRGQRLAMPAKGLQARNAVEKYINVDNFNLDVCLEINEANILLDIVENNNLITILSEATIRNRSLLKAIPLDLPDNQMQGCIHMLKKVYHKRSADVFIKMLRECCAVRELAEKWL